MDYKTLFLVFFVIADTKIRQKAIPQCTCNLMFFCKSNPGVLKIKLWNKKINDLHVLILILIIIQAISLLQNYQYVNKETLSRETKQKQNT